MVLRILLAMLLFGAVICRAGSTDNYVRTVHNEGVHIVLLPDHFQDITALSTQLEQILERIEQPIEWIILPRQDDASVLQQVQAYWQDLSACQRLSVLLLFSPDNPAAAEQASLIGLFKESGIDVSAIQASTDQLEPLLYRYFLQQHNSRYRKAMPIQLQHVVAVGPYFLLNQLEATTLTRWYGHLHLLEAPTDDVDVDGAVRIDVASVINTGQRVVWLDDGQQLVRLENALETAGNWLSFFALSSALQATLEPYFAENLAETLLQSLAGLDIQGQPWPVLGDMPHTRPLLLDDGQKQSIVAASNDGSLHWFDYQPGNAIQPVSERFVIKPAAFLPAQPLLLWNSGADAHPYTLDGELSVIMRDRWRKLGNQQGSIDTDCSGCRDSIWLYAGLRRGGRAIYHYDVSDVDHPLRAGMISKTQQGNFDALGLTFSRPVPLMVRFADKPVAALLFGGGYDAAVYDGAEQAALSLPATEGHALYLVNAVDRSLIWKVVYGNSEVAANQFYRHPAMRYAIPSAVTILDSDADGMADTAYVGDIAGQVWRVDIPACLAEQCLDEDFRQQHWSARRLASLGNNSRSGNIRFFHAPVLWQQNGQRMLALASGDIENPLENTAQNYLFALADHNETALTADQLPDIRSCVDGTCGTGVQGWKFHLLPGEKASGSPVIHAGSLLLNTVQPQPATCTVQPDVRRLYRVSLPVGRQAEWQWINLQADSLLSVLDAQNVRQLGRYVAQLFPSLLTESASLSENAHLPVEEIGTALQRDGIVINYWREQHND